MTDHMEAAVKAAAEAIHEAGWTCEAHEPLGLEKCDQCAISTPALARKTLTAALPELVAEVERLQAQIQAAQQLLADLKNASDHQYNRNLVALRLKQALGENQ